jgi:hypothetical protein
MSDKASTSAQPAIELVVVMSGFMQCDAQWLDGEPTLCGVPEAWLDLMPYLIARKLLEQGYDAERELIVHLAGADYDLMRAPLGLVAATPVLGAVPVKHGARCVYSRSTHV